jgi:hypothetical protein
MNTFDNWQQEEQSLTEMDSVRNRAREIKKMIEVDYQIAKTNIEKSQERQKKQQDIRGKPRLEDIKNDTKVYVKVVGMHDKLHPKYRGPFIVSERAKGGNYLLKGITGKAIEESFPIERLKVVKSDEMEKSEEYFIVENIVDYRKTAAGDYEYHVKWKGFPKEQNTWEPANSFIEKDVISNYWKNKGKFKKKRGRKLKSIPMAVIAIFCNLFFYGVYSMEEGCNLEAEKEFKVIAIGVEIRNMSLLTKLENQVKGPAIECSKELVQVTTYTYFFGAQSKETKTETKRFTKAECEIMEKTKLCGNDLITKEEYGWSFDGSPMENISG